MPAYSGTASRALNQKLGDLPSIKDWAPGAGRSRVALGNCTAGSARVTATTSLFAPEDVGKAISLEGGISSTVAAYVSATAVDIAVPATVTVADCRLIVGEPEDDMWASAVAGCRGALYLPQTAPGTCYWVRSAVTLAHPICIHGSGALVEFDPVIPAPPGSPDTLFNVQANDVTLADLRIRASGRVLSAEGTLVGARALLQDVRQGQTYVRMAGSAPSPGAWLSISDNRLGGYYPVEMARVLFVRAIAGGVECRLQSPIRNFYAVANSGQVFVYSPIERLTVDGVDITMTDGSDISQVAFFNRCVDLRVDGLRLGNHRNARNATAQVGVYVASCSQVSLSGMGGFSRVGNGDFLAIEASSDVTLDGARIEGYSFGVGVTRSTAVSVRGCQIRGGSRARTLAVATSGAATLACDTDLPSDLPVVITSNAPPEPFARATLYYVSVVSGGLQLSATQGGAAIVPTESGTVQLANTGRGVKYLGCQRAIVAHNQISGFDTGIRLSNTGRSMVNENSITACGVNWDSGAIVLSSLGVDADNIFNDQGCVVRGNVIWRVEGSGVLIFPSYTRVKVDDNDIDQCTSNAIWAPLSFRSVFVGNQIESWGIDLEYEDGTGSPVVSGSPSAMVVHQSAWVERNRMWRYDGLDATRPGVYFEGVPTEWSAFIANDANVSRDGDLVSKLAACPRNYANHFSDWHQVRGSGTAPPAGTWPDGAYWENEAIGFDASPAYWVWRGGETGAWVPEGTRYVGREPLAPGQDGGVNWAYRAVAPLIADGDYIPVLAAYNSDLTRPKAALDVKVTSAGSRWRFGVSDDYAAGITRFSEVNHQGWVGAGLSGADTAVSPVHGQNRAARSALIGLTPGIFHAEGDTGTPGVQAMTFGGAGGAPIGAIGVKKTGSGSQLLGGVSAEYAAGITTQVVILDHLGRPFPDTALRVLASPGAEGTSPVARAAADGGVAWEGTGAVTAAALDAVVSASGGAPAQTDYPVRVECAPGSGYTPLLVWRSPAGVPVGALVGWSDGSGSRLYLGTSNDYGVGITHWVAVRDGRVGAGALTPIARLHSEESGAHAMLGSGPGPLHVHQVSGGLAVVSFESTSGVAGKLGMRFTGSGSQVVCGVSTNYASGVTAEVVICDHLGRPFPGYTFPSGDLAGSSILTPALIAVGSAGTYTKVTTDAQGRVSSGEQAAFSDLAGTIASHQMFGWSGTVSYIKPGGASGTLTVAGGVITAVT